MDVEPLLDDDRTPVWRGHDTFSLDDAMP